GALCVTVSDAAALILAMTIDPETATARAGVTPPDEPSAAATASPSASTTTPAAEPSSPPAPASPAAASPTPKRVERSRAQQRPTRVSRLERSAPDAAPDRNDAQSSARERPPPPASRTQRAPVWRLGAGGISDVGTLGGVGAAFELGGAAVLGALR